MLVCCDLAPDLIANVVDGEGVYFLAVKMEVDTSKFLLSSAFLTTFFENSTPLCLRF